MAKKSALVIIFLSLSVFVYGQLSIIDENPVVIDFDTDLPGVNNGQFTGDGFQPTPSSGRLDSDAWSITSDDDNLGFGGTETGTFSRLAKGISQGNANSSDFGIGIYAFDVGGMNHTLGIKPKFSGATEFFTPGEIILKIENNSANNILSFVISYTLYYNNLGNDENNFRFSHSSDNSNYIELPELEEVTPSSGMAGINWESVIKNVIIDLQAPLAPGSEYFLKWSGNSFGDQEDEIALDDITIQAIDDSPNSEPTNHVTDFTFIEVAATQAVLYWNESFSGDLPEGYLILGREVASGTYASVADGVPVPDDTDFIDPDFNGAINLVVGSNTTIVTGLTPATDYSFIIYPYSNSGSIIDYKTDGMVPEVFYSTSGSIPMYSIDFDNNLPGFNRNQYQGIGIDFIPENGELDSDAWRITGLNGQSSNFGDDIGDMTVFSRGASQGDVGGSEDDAGIYAYEVSTGDFALGARVDARGSGNTFAPGEFVLRFENNTTTPFDRLFVSYDFIFNNKSPSAHTFQLLYSEDDSEYFPSVNATTPHDSGIPGIDWESNNHQAHIFLNAPLQPGADFYLKWRSELALDDGDEDELALDNIYIEGVVDGAEILPEPSDPIIDLMLDITTTTATLFWTEGMGSVAAEGYLITVERGPNALLPNVIDGDPYPLGFNQTDGTGAVVVGVGNPEATITGLLQSTEYEFRIYPFTNQGMLIDYKTDMVGSATGTTGQSINNQGSRIEAGIGVSTIDPTDNGDVEVFTFSIVNDPGQPENETQIDGITFTQGPGNEINDWSTVIESAQLEEIQGSSTTSLTIFPDRLEDLTLPNNFIDVSGTEDYRVTIRLKSNLDAQLGESVDGKNLVLELSGYNIILDNGANRNLIAVGTNANSGNNNGRFDAVVSEIQVFQQPSTNAIADVPLIQQPIFRAVDSDGNADTDFSGTVTLLQGTSAQLSFDGTAPNSFTNGILDYAGSGLNIVDVGTTSLELFASGQDPATTSSITVTAETNIDLVTNGVATSPLNCNAQDQVVFGFSMSTTGSLPTVSNISLRSFPSDNDFLDHIADFDLVISVDDDPQTTNDNILIEEYTVAGTGFGVFFFFSLPSLTLSPSPTHFFLLADIKKNTSTSTLQFGFDNDIIPPPPSVSKGQVTGLTTVGPLFSIEDNCAPIIQEVNVSNSLINEFDNVQTVTVKYDERMNTNNAPAISLGGSWGAQATGSWSSDGASNNVYTTTFTHQGVGETLTALTATVDSNSGATDFNGNSDTGGLVSSTAFIIDTEKPVVISASRTNSEVRIGNTSQTITLEYSEDMNIGSNPSFSFVGTTNMTFLSGGWEPDNRTWIGNYNHNGTAEFVEDVSINDPGTFDVNGNRSVIGGLSEGQFDIDMRNHAPTINTIDPVVINEDALQQTINFDGITDSDNGEQTVVSVTAVSDNTALIPNPIVNYNPDDTNGSLQFTPVENANSDDLGSATITVTVTDDGGTTAGGQNETSTDFLVTVTAQNDAPVVSAATFNIEENTANGMPVGTVNASDVEDDNLTFSIVAGDDLNVFTIDENSGEITVNMASELDFEDNLKPNIYRLTVQAQDDGVGMLTGENDQISITITDVNDPPTQITLPKTDIAASTGAVLVGKLNMIDQDAGDSPSDFNFIGSSNNNAFFEIRRDLPIPNTTRWDLWTATSTISGQSLSIELRVTDQNSATHDQSFTINVLAEGTDIPSAPTDLLLSSITIAEKLPAGTSVGTLTSEDENAGNNHLYTLVSGTGDSDNDAFSIQGDQLIANASLNYSLQNSYSIRIQTDDQTGEAPFSRSFTIAVIDTPPAIISRSPATNAINVAVNESLSFTFDEAVFAGSGTTRIVRSSDNSVIESIDISASNLNGVGTNTISIDPLNDLPFSTLFHIEIDPTVFQDVTSNNFTGISNSSDWVFETVNFVPNDILLSNNEIAQGQAVSTGIGIFSTSDQDESNTHLYTLVAGEGSTDNASFAIDGQTLRSAIIFDATAQSEYSIRVKTDDQRGGTLEKAFTILVTAPIDSDGPIITRSSNFPTIYQSGSGSLDLSFNITDTDGQVATAEMSVRSFSSESSDAKILSPDISGDNYTFSVQESVFDRLGIIYNLTAVDNSSNASDNGGTITIGFNEEPQDVPQLPSGGSETSYRIISIPYVLEDNRITDIFDELGAFDDTKWRLLQHRNDGSCCLEFTKGITTIVPGAGYWFNQVSNTSVTIENGSVVESTIDDLFAIRLSPGWNMIGDPYPFPVSWSDIVDFNANPDELESLRVYDGSWSNGTSLEPFEGGVVRWNGSSDFELLIPVTGQPGGRKLQRDNLNPIDHPNWEIQLNLDGASMGNHLSAFGMHPEALDGRDRHDETTVPRFFKYLEINFANGEGEQRSKDIVETNVSRKWQFSVNSNLNEKVRLSWRNDYFGDNNFELFLIDLETNQIYDMRDVNGIDLKHTDEHYFNIYYGEDLSLEEVTFEYSIEIGEPYPNPFDNELQIDIVLPEIEDAFLIEIRALDVSGRLAGSNRVTVASGIQNIDLKTLINSDQFKTGFYVMEIAIEGSHFTKTVTRKLLKN